MNQEEEQTNNEENKFEVATLTAQQHPITPVPKFTTELPFFYFTQQKRGLTKTVQYEGVDEVGRPIRWTATPNLTIGAPAIEAHEVWTRLIKPTWEAYRLADGRLPDILPLGGVRRCLRVVGWCEGGWEARRLLKVIHQIGASWCTADFWLPTSKKDEQGKILFRSIKGAFSRLEIYAIGEKHVTEEELKDGKFNFDFNLDDTLYIRFSPLEVAIQESQPQRYLDNEYMFSVRPMARRWYELMAAKIFGVVKNGGHHCEILYSWYVKHHHTLNRHLVRWKVMEQMNDIVRDHIASGFITRVGYLPIKEPGKEIDFLIRYYPGRAARESMKRVLRALTTRPSLPEPAPRIPRRKKKLTEVENLKIPPGITDDNGGVSQIKLLPAPESSIPSEIIQALNDRGVMGALAVLKALSSEQLERVKDVIEYWDEIRGSKGPGLLINLIKTNEPLPRTFESSREKKRRQLETERRQRLRDAKEFLDYAYSEYQKEAVDQYISQTLSEQEYSQRVEVEKEKIKPEAGIRNPSPELIEHLAERAIRTEIAKEVSVLPFEEFCRREARRVLAPHGIDPAELGIASEPARATGETESEDIVTPDDQSGV